MSTACGGTTKVSSTNHIHPRSFWHLFVPYFQVLSIGPSDISGNFSCLFMSVAPEKAPCPEGYNDSFADHQDSSLCVLPCSSLCFLKDDSEHVPPRLKTTQCLTKASYTKPKPPSGSLMLAGKSIPGERGCTTSPRTFKGKSNTFCSLWNIHWTLELLFWGWNSDWTWEESTKILNEAWENSFCDSLCLSLYLSLYPLIFPLGKIKKLNCLGRCAYINRHQLARTLPWTFISNWCTEKDHRLQGQPITDELGKSTVASVSSSIQ